MGQFSVKIYLPTGSVLNGNQHNQAQLLCMADYDTVMRRSDRDPRVKYLTYNREFMMGTLSHVAHG